MMLRSASRHCKHHRYFSITFIIPSHLFEFNVHGIYSLKSSSKPLEFLSKRPSHRLNHLAGIESIVDTIRELVFYPISYPQLYKDLGVLPPCGILLHGPSGCGKTSLALSIAGELDLPFYKASGPELIGGTSGESEERIRAIFEAAVNDAPSVLFIDAIDVLALKKDVRNYPCFPFNSLCYFMHTLLTCSISPPFIHYPR